MLELLVLLSVLALCLALLSVVGFAAALAAGVGLLMVVIFFDWLRHRWLPVQRWLDAKLGHRLRPLFAARVTILLTASLCAFLGWLAYLWYVQPTA